MCGLAGIIAFTEWTMRRGEEVLPREWLDLLDARIQHRGPDGAGRFRQSTVVGGGAVHVALVHRRLSILDEAGGAQPMVSARGRRARSQGAAATILAGGADQPAAEVGGELAGVGGAGGAGGAVAVVFNGCIYNHRELRRELVTAGHEFASDHSDTEVLVHGWREWGKGLFDKIEGMFAVAVYDERAGTVTLARDRFGEKPLFLARFALPGGGQAFAFSSVAAALYPFAERTTEGLDDWLRFGFAAGPPLFDIVAVAPASSLEIAGPRGMERSPRVTLNEHWFCMEGEARTFPRRDEPLDEQTVERLVVRAVEQRLEADVPLGCFLSGGVDSSLVAAVARRALGKLKTFTVKMPVEAYDESAAAEAVARHIGTEHSTLPCAARPAEDLVGLIEQMGLPLGDSSLLPAHWVSRAARGQVKVALSGDGGDEFFCGYERYSVADMLMGPMRRLLSVIPAAVLPRSDPKAFTTKLARLIGAAGGNGYIELVSIFQTRQLRKLTGRGERPREERWAWHGAGNAMAWDVANMLPGDLLCKMDGASMACGLEVRAPLLDRALSVAALSAPLKTLCPRGTLKGLLKNVAAGFVPRAVVERNKMGFAVPMGEWLRTDFGGVRKLLMDGLGSKEPFGPPALGIELRKKAIDRMITEHMGGRVDHGQRLYLLMVLSLWARHVGRVKRVV